MSARDLHADPFDEGTAVKLSLFSDYLTEWLPVFLKRADPIWNTINIVDFFAGPGTDVAGELGSPLIILESLMPYNAAILEKKLSVNVYLNELHNGKFQNLIINVDGARKDCPSVNVHLTNSDFDESFAAIYPRLKGCANLLFFDQSGIKYFTKSVLQSVASLSATDFLVFVSSSTINRFSEHESIRKYIGIDQKQIDSEPYNKIHRLVLEYFRQQIPADKEYYLFPFSIKKGRNIYGLIFGSGHILGAKKFLDACWRRDPERGEANFDIDGDNLTPDNPYLFEQMNKPAKLQSFNAELTEGILSRHIQSDWDACFFALSRGFRLAHAGDMVKSLEKKGVIKSGHYRFSLDAKKEPRPLELK